MHGQELLRALEKVSWGISSRRDAQSGNSHGKTAWMVQNPLQMWLFSTKAHGKGLRLSWSSPNIWEDSRRGKFNFPLEKPGRAWKWRESKTLVLSPLLAGDEFPGFGDSQVFPYHPKCCSISPRIHRGCREDPLPALPSGKTVPPISSGIRIPWQPLL